MPDGTGEARAVRRRWSRETKRRIVAESHASGASVNEVAARYGVAPSLLSVWRGLIGEEPATTPAVTGFIPVHLMEAASAEAPRRCDVTPSPTDASCLCMILPDGTRLYISHAAQLPLLHGVLGVLRQ